MTDEPIKRRRGRPAGQTMTEVVPLRMSAEQAGALRTWAEGRDLTLSTAARLIIAERMADEMPTPARSTPSQPLRDPFAEVTSPLERARLLEPTIRALIGVNADGLNAICRGLNASGVKAPEGGQWHPKTVARVLELLGITARGMGIGDGPSA